MSDNNQKIVYEGNIIRVVQKQSPSGKTLETATRPPGTRIILHNLETNEILLTREIRLDIGEDYRLPGGKVRDTNIEWDQIKDNPNLDLEIIEAGAKETREEVGYDVSDLKIFCVSNSGGPTIKWDMYYLVATKFYDRGHQELESDEQITTKWYPIKEVINACLTGKIREGRSVATLLQYLHSIGEM
ncbi:MAG: NUDIX domain-containing protein [Candidatus Shapirobacteria bacterium]